jgi:HD-GYP domain-containing protein (c-di-GMP phosphodiesterase class II)
MLNIVLPFAINDLDGRELLASGSKLDASAIVGIAAKGRQMAYEHRCMLQHGSIRSDLTKFMGDGQYAFIFGGPEGIDAHLHRIGELPIPAPLLSILDDFRATDFYTYRHSLIVFSLTSLLMEKMFELSQASKNMLMVGPIHDIGKWLIPREILRKKTPLTRQEKSLLELHPITGYILLSHYFGDHYHPAAQIALNHHERRDGSGYPRGINEVDPLVEMVATCDVYDALVSSRPYRPVNYDNRTALEELTNTAEAGALDWRCVQALIGQNRSGHPMPETVDVSLQKRGTPPPGNCYTQIADEDVIIEATSGEQLTIG